jgi:hypothetical protein
MKSLKLKYSITISTVFCALTLISILLITNDTDNKSNIIINYNRYSSIDEESEVRITPEDENTGVEFMPVPDINKSITLEAL